MVYELLHNNRTIGADDNIFPTLTNPHNLTVSYTSSKEEVATINANGDITLVGAGTTTISAIFEGNDTYEASTVTYSLTVKKAIDPNEKGQVNNPYTVAEALEAINALDNGATTSDKFYVKGFVVGTPDIQKKEDGTFYGNANFDIADTKGGSSKLTCYRLKGLDNANIESESYIKENDELVVMGQLQKYVKNEEVTPEVKNGYIYSINGSSGINNIIADQLKNGAVYNVAGQMVTDSYKGLVIKNGKKFIQK